ncbi:DUF7282 domain-containing protein [Natronorubrum tibetense]|uniref:Uncharacterized protein n=1 Tax=Natronorubrum tibetense GA33 TaxID=1114856 RepID=L9VFC0_9EURY|nr:CARDB domain-containing protein [Natronorubrum tibetense]ELY35910.1 hypothetical protein C496_22314 [Natronorubrum tibetense GA33]
MSAKSTLGTIKRVGAILIAIAIVLAAGIVVGQAPAIFGVEDDPEASIEFEDQQGDGESVVIGEVTLSDGGFVVLTNGGDESLAVSDYLESGTHENVTIERAEDAEEDLVGQLTATVHQDTTGDGYAYEESEGEEDRPYLEDGFPVSDTASVTTTLDDDALSDSFTVDSISAPTTATTNDTIEVTAEITNPTEIESQQNVEFRLGGTVLEQQALELGSGETREVTFQIDTVGAPPGEQPIGVYTDGDGAITTIDLEFHTDPAIEVVDASEENVTVDVATPVDGFVGIEAENGSLIGTSDDLEPGEHSNVTAEFDDDAEVDDDEELTAVLYEGESDDDEPTPFEDEDGDGVETTFTIADVENDDDGDEGGEDDNGADDE